MCKWILLIITAIWIVVCECKQSWRNNKKPTIQHQANKDYWCNSLTNQKCNCASTYTEKHCHSLSYKSRVSMIQSLSVTVVISLSNVYWLLQLILPGAADRGGWTGSDEIRTDLNFHPRPETLLSIAEKLQIFSLFFYISKWFRKKKKKKQTLKTSEASKASNQKMPDLQDFAALICIDVHKSIQNKVYLFWGE